MLAFAYLFFFSFVSSRSLLLLVVGDDTSTAPTSLLPPSALLSALFRSHVLAIVICLSGRLNGSGVTGKLHSNHAVLQLPSATDDPNVVRFYAAQMSLRNNGFPLAA